MSEIERPSVSSTSCSVISRLPRRVTPTARVGTTILSAVNQTAPSVLRVAVVEDQPLYRAMLARTLDAHDRLHVVASVGTVADARAALATVQVDVAVLDIDLPDGNGIALGVQLRRAHPSLGILLLSAHDAMDLLLDLPKDVSHGWGYLSKVSSTSETLLVDAVLAAACGQTMLDPALLAGMRPRRGSDVARLTDRQFEEAEAILDRMEACQDAAKWTALNEQFHNSLYAGTASPRLKTLIAGQYVALARYSNVHVGALDYRRRADEEHRGLLEACRTRDIAVATSALSKHIRASGEEIAKVLEGSQQGT